MRRFLSERLLTQLTLLTVGVALFLSTLGVGAGLPAAQSPVFFPQIILGLWIALTLIDLIQDLGRRREAQSVDRLLAMIACVGAAMVYVTILTTLGFALSSALFSVVALLLFGVRSPIAILLYAVLVPGALVLVFNHLLGMPLPTSPFTYLF